MEILQTIKKIKKVAKQNSEKTKLQKTHEITLKSLPIGKCYRQGDLYIFRVPNDWPVGEEIKRDKIAEGVSLGSTHILMGDFKIYQGIKTPKCLSELHARIGLGYAFDCKNNSVNIHMEHDHFVFLDGGRFQVVHQVDIRTLKKVSD